MTLRDAIRPIEVSSFWCAARWIGYNAQVAVDARHKLIVEQHVTNACNDRGLLASFAGAARSCSASSGSMRSLPWATTKAKTLTRAKRPA